MTLNVQKSHIFFIIEHLKKKKKKKLTVDSKKFIQQRMTQLREKKSETANRENLRKIRINFGFFSLASLLLVKVLFAEGAPGGAGA